MYNMTIVYRPDDFFTAWNEGFYQKRILIEGDSWVSHPQMDNLADQFNKNSQHNNLILNLAKPGDNAGSRYGNSDAVFRKDGPQMKWLKNGRPNTDWFHDEIHPSSADSNRVFNKIRKDAINAGVWPLY